MLLLKLDLDVVAPPIWDDSQRQACVDLGGALFEAVFRDGIMLAWSRSQDVLEPPGRDFGSTMPHTAGYAAMRKKVAPWPGRTWAVEGSNGAGRRRRKVIDRSGLGVVD